MSTPTDLNAAALPVDSKIRFDGKATSWRVRAHTEAGRYTIATASVGRYVLYTIIDWQESERGAMNVIGGGLGIFTRSGPDENIDEAIEMLEEGIRFEAECLADGSIPSGHWGLSHRHNVPLVITVARPAKETATR